MNEITQEQTGIDGTSSAAASAEQNHRFSHSQYFKPNSGQDHLTVTVTPFLELNYKNFGRIKTHNEKPRLGGRVGSGAANPYQGITTCKGGVSSGQSQSRRFPARPVKVISASDPAANLNPVTGLILWTIAAVVIGLILVWGVGSRL